MVGFLRSLFFESLVLLLIVQAVAVAIALAMHRRRLTRGSRLGLLATVGVCILLLVVQSVVKTDREQIQAAVAAMARAIDDGDIPTLGEHLDREFSDRGMDKTAWLADVRQRLQRWRIDEARVRGFKTEADGDTAVVSFQASCDWRSGEQAPQPVYSRWKLGFVRRPEGWKLHRVISATGGPGGMLDYATMLQY